MCLIIIIIIIIIIILWLSSGDLKAETESVIKAARDRYYKQNTMLQKYYKQKQITNADLSTGNETYTTLYPLVQSWQKKQYIQ